MTGLLELKNVHVAYGAHKVIRGIDLSLARGEFCALLGLNGSGKTTLLHAICNFIPMQGECFVSGSSLSGLNERQRARLLSFIPQVSTQMGGKRVIDVVLMGLNPHLGLFESPSAEHIGQAKEMLERLDMGAEEEKDFGTLSQGQKQMITLARCLIQNAPVMLMDEPDSALDFNNRHRMLQKVQQLIREDQRAGLITLHDPNFAMAYCDRLVLLKDGGIAADISMHDTSLDAIKAGLSKVYGNIDLISHQNRYIMVRGLETEKDK